MVDGIGDPHICHSTARRYDSRIFLLNKAESAEAAAEGELKLNSSLVRLTLRNLEIADAAVKGEFLKGFKRFHVVLMHVLVFVLTLFSLALLLLFHSVLSLFLSLSLSVSRSHSLSIFPFLLDIFSFSWFLSFPPSPFSWSFPSHFLIVCFISLFLSYKFGWPSLSPPPPSLSPIYHFLFLFRAYICQSVANSNTNLSVSISLLSNESISQSISLSISLSVSLSINQSVGQSVC